MKRFFPVLTALALAVSLAACGGKTAQAASSQSASASSAPAISQAAVSPAGYYETAGDDPEGYYYALDIGDDHTGVYRSLGPGGEGLDGSAFTWNDDGTLTFDNAPQQVFTYTVSGNAITLTGPDGVTDRFERTEISPEVGFFCHTYEEELDGTPVQYTYWVIGSRNGTGKFLMQDEIDVDWHDGAFYYQYNGEKAYDYHMDADGNLVLVFDFPDGTTEEAFERSQGTPDGWGEPQGSDAGGSEYTMADLEGTWGLSFYVVDAEGSPEYHDAATEDVSAFAEFTVTSAGDLTALYRYETQSGSIELPQLQAEYVEGVLNSDYYNTAWYARLTGTGTICDPDKDPQPYYVTAGEQPADATQWVEMCASVYDSDGMLIREVSHVDGLEQPIVNELYFDRSVG